jgi:hypothetical protein
MYMLDESDPLKRRILKYVRKSHIVASINWKWQPTFMVRCCLYVQKTQQVHTVIQN